MNAALKTGKSPKLWGRAIESGQAGSSQIDVVTIGSKVSPKGNRNPAPIDNVGGIENQIPTVPVRVGLSVRITKAEDGRTNAFNHGPVAIENGLTRVPKATGIDIQELHSIARLNGSEIRVIESVTSRKQIKCVRREGPCIDK